MTSLVWPEGQEIACESNFPNRFNVIWVVQLCRKKYFTLRPPQITSIIPLSHPSEGRLENVTDAGWDAVDAGGDARRAALTRTGRALIGPRPFIP
jgi:hypothetical protein